MQLTNKIQCNICKDIIESLYGHDFKFCSCGAVAVDGGKSYLRRVGNPEDYTDISVASDKHEDIREHLTWGTFGKKGNQPLKYKPIKELDTDHLESILKTQWHIYGTPIENVIKRELEYRRNNDKSD